MANNGTFVKLHKTLAGHGAEINFVAFSETQLALASSRNVVHLYDNVTFNQKPSHFDHSYPVQCVDFTEDGSLMASCAMDGVCCIRRTCEDVATTKHEDNQPVVARIQHRVNSPFRTLSFSADGKFLVTGSIDSTACVWEINDNMKMKCCVNIPETSIKTCTFTPCSLVFVVGTFNGNMHFFNISGTQIFRHEAHDMGTSCIDISRKFTYGGHSSTCVYTIVTGGNDSKLKVWRFEYNVKNKCSIAMLHNLRGHSASITSCQFSHDSRLIVSGSLDMTAQLWDAVKGDHLHTIAHHTRYITCCCFSRNDQFIATASGDQTLVVWTVTSKLLKEGGYKGFKNLRSMLPISYWSTEDVIDWLKNHNFKAFVTKFRQNNVDGLKLNGFSDESIKEMFRKDKTISPDDMSSFLKKRLTICSPRDNLNTESDENTPPEFTCPIKHEIMLDPVIASDGYSYERFEITRWLDQNANKSQVISPMTGANFATRTLIDNINLKIAIRRYQNSNNK